MDAGETDPNRVMGVESWMSVSVRVDWLAPVIRRWVSLARNNSR